MRKVASRLVKSAIRRLVNSGFRIRGGRYFLEEAVQAAMTRSWPVRHGETELSFTVPNQLNFFRVRTFSTKEPETLEWIDQLPTGAVLWDIGANVGLYACYAAKARNCRVYAFEPSVFNLELLARNISLNGLTSQVTIVPLPLTDARAVSTLNMTSTDWGGALSTFGQTYGQDGQALQKLFEFRTIGISMEDAVGFLGVPQPDYIKMDVDGIEHLILKGGAGVLRNARGVLIEINDEFEKQATDAARYLHEAGLVLKEKRHSEMFENTSFRNSYNQIWVRPPA